MTTFKKITEWSAATAMDGSDYVLAICGGTPKRITLDNLRLMMEENQQQFLDENAFYVEENTAHTTVEKCYTGGNKLMRQIWLSKICAVLMDTEGHYTKLNNNDFRYTADGDTVVSNGAVVSAYANADWMGMFEGGYWNYLQEITISGVKHIRHHMSLTPLPGGWYTSELPAGLFKCVVVNNAMRSIPFVVPTASKNINQFYNAAQARGKNFGLAGEPLRNLLLEYMLAKYGYRDCQNLKGEDGTLVWGVGLDGTVSDATLKNGFTYQQGIKTGACLSMGYNDGKVEVTDSQGNTCHSVQVGVWENPWGQYWEMDGHLCSVGTDVYQWDSNFMPTGTPTADSFAGVETHKFTRMTANSQTFDVSLVTTAGAQRMSYVPTASHTGVSWHDQFYYGADGQLWRVGGSSSNGSNCGLACSDSYNGWSYSFANFSARLDFHGDTVEVTSAELKRLLAQ